MIIVGVITLINYRKESKPIKEKQLYEITYQAYGIHTEIIAAKSPQQAIRKFHRKHVSCWDVIDIKLYKMTGVE